MAEGYYSECHLSWVSHVSLLCWMPLCWVSWRLKNQPYIISIVYGYNSLDICGSLAVLLSLLSKDHRYLKNIDCLSFITFIMWPLLASPLPRAFLAFLLQPLTVLMRQRRQYLPFITLSFLDVYAMDPLDICGNLRRLSRTRRHLRIYRLLNGTYCMPCLLQ